MIKGMYNTYNTYIEEERLHFQKQKNASKKLSQVGGSSGGDSRLRLTLHSKEIISLGPSPLPPAGRNANRFYYHQFTTRSAF